MMMTKISVMDVLNFVLRLNVKLKVRIILVLCNDCLGDNHIRRRGNLYILSFALNECDFMPSCLYHRSIIGECRREWLLVGFSQHLGREHLWGLYHS